MVGSPYRTLAVGISLPPDMLKACDWLADQHGHGNRSRVIQSLLDRAMIGEVGIDWRADRRFRPERAAADVAASEQSQSS